MSTSYRASVPPSDDPGPASRPHEPVRLRARRPADLLAAVPYLLGFHPAESLVALLLRGGRVVLSARYDLVPGAPPDVDALVAQHRPSGVVLVAYCADAARGRAALEEQAVRLGDVEVVDLLVVDGRRWWSLVCTTGCCPPEGTPYAPQDHPLSAEAVWAGLVARPDRAAVVATVAGPPDAVGDRLRERAAVLEGGLGPTGRRGRRGRQDRLARAVVAALDTDGTVGTVDEDVALELALLVRDVVVRDVACALVTRQDAHRHLALWQEVVARTPPELAPAPLCLLGVSAWADGNGTLLNACCERLADLDPAYPMGRLLADVSARALPPAWWDAMADGLRRDLGLVGRGGRPEVPDH